MQILGKIPVNTKFYVACSGGMDSMVLVDFLLRYPKNKFELCFFNHNTDSDNIAQQFLQDFVKDNSKLILNIGTLNRDKNKNESPEEFWRNERYNYLNQFNGPVLTAHHLDDVIETWIFSSFRGTPKLIPYSRDNIIRPFLLVSKSEIINWSINNNISYINDTDNENDNLDRNYIRHNVIPHVLRINKGIHKTIKKKIINETKFN